MKTLGKPSGYFSLNDSDRKVGSFFSCEDLYSILQIDRISQDEFSTHLKKAGLINEFGYVDEGKLYYEYKCITKLFSSSYLPKISFDEYVLRSLISRALPGAIISSQVIVPEIGGKSPVDFLINYNGSSIYIEFDGPSHFANVNNYPVRDSRNKKERIQDLTNTECVCWPFWMQRCETNVKALFDKNIQGVGALWSTNCLFGDFCIDRPSELIVSETKRFNAVRDDGIGYFYGWDNNELRTIPKHPIIKKIQDKKRPVKRIIPPDVNNNYEFWLPKCLWDLL